MALIRHLLNLLDTVFAPVTRLIHLLGQLHRLEVGLREPVFSHFRPHLHNTDIVPLAAVPDFVNLPRMLFEGIRPLLLICLTLHGKLILGHIEGSDTLRLALP